MAAAASKVATSTTLKIGEVEIPIGLFSTVDKPKSLPGFVTAGPNGGELRLQPVAAPEPERELSDPFAVDGAWEQAATQRVESAPDRQAAAREALAAEAEGDAHSRGLVAGEYRQQLVEAGTGQVVTPGEVRRGVRLGDRFVDCTDELAKIEERTRLDAARVVAFVDATAIPRMRVKAAYYIGSDDPFPVALRIVHDGLRRTRRAAIVKLTKKTRQTLGAIVPARGTLMLLELVWSDDFRPAPERATRIQNVAEAPAAVDRFCELVDAMSYVPRVIDGLRDDAIALREELLERAVAGEIDVTSEPVDPVDEMSRRFAAALKGS